MLVHDLFRALNRQRAGELSIAADALHLLTALLWPVGLLPLAICLAKLRRHRELGPSVSMMTQRFSRMSIASVPILAITGGPDAWMIAGGLPSLDSAYGRLLATKAVLFAVMLGAGAINLVKIRRPDFPNAERTIRSLFLNVCIETAIFLRSTRRHGHSGPDAALTIQAPCPT